jgi:D-tyrosyl-tRNA(Tyr) deacylase
VTRAALGRLRARRFTCKRRIAHASRPDFSGAATREQTESLYERFSDELRALGVPVDTGVFGARMELELVNDGPVTIIIDV